MEINGVRHTRSLVLTTDSAAQDWDTDFASLSPQTFADLLDWAPELVVFGSGSVFRFPHPRLTQALAERRIGLEVMDTRAACRTFNVLAAEGRRVLAALLIE